MTNLSKLKVSLTKHGAHKIATLLKKLPADQVLNNLNGSVKDVHIDHGQARKNLSAQGNGVPTVWSDIQALGDSAIDSMVLLSIIFSHNSLIQAMAKSATGTLAGTLIRDRHLLGKEYTNFSHTLEQLGFVTRQDGDSISYDLTPLLDPRFGYFAKEIFNLKLSTAGWEGYNSVEDEAVIQGFHNSLSITEAEMRNWLRGTNLQTKIAPSTSPIEDEEFFSESSDTITSSPFSFVAGHTQRAEGTINISIPKDKITAELIHNKIQNELYLFLENKYGKGCVGTEVPTGDGTSIDVVLNKNNKFWFYEIKTAASVKTTIRQALPQLLEYAYWPNENKADRLIIVSQLPPSDRDEKYLETLRERFGIPIYYQQFCLSSKVLKP